MGVFLWRGVEVILREDVAVSTAMDVVAELYVAEDVAIDVVANNRSLGHIKKPKKRYA